MCFCCLPCGGHPFQEKKAREEERLQKQRLKQEEKERKAEEKRRQEEAENAKAQKAKAAFTNFFVKKSPEQKAEVSAEESKGSAAAPANDYLSKFIVKKNMRLAPVARAQFSEGRRRVLEGVLDSGKRQCLGTFFVIINPD